MSPTQGVFLALQARSNTGKGMALLSIASVRDSSLTNPPSFRYSPGPPRMLERSSGLAAHHWSQARHASDKTVPTTCMRLGPDLGSTALSYATSHCTSEPVDSSLPDPASTSSFHQGRSPDPGLLLGKATHLMRAAGAVALVGAGRLCRYLEHFHIYLLLRLNGLVGLMAVPDPPNLGSPILSSSEAIEMINYTFMLDTINRDCSGSAARTGIGIPELRSSGLPSFPLGAVTAARPSNIPTQQLRLSPRTYTACCPFTLDSHIPSGCADLGWF